MVEVRCKDCGHTWEFSGENPETARCSKAECGRSRNTEVVGQDADADDGEQDPDDQGDGAADLETRADDGQPESGSEPAGSEPESGDSGTYTPGFEAQDTDDADPLEASPGLEDGDDDQGGEQDADDQGERQPEDVPELDPEQVERSISATFEILARRRGPHWELEDPPGEKGDAELLAEAWTPVINEYAPLLLREYFLVATALGTTYAVVGPKLATEMELREQREAQQEDDRALDREDENQQTLGEAVQQEATDPEAGSSIEVENDSLDQL